MMRGPIYVPGTDEIVFPESLLLVSMKKVLDNEIDI